MQIACVSTGLPPLGETQETENLVPALAVRYLPRQSLVVVPPVAALQIPLVPQGEVDELAMEQVGEVLDGPVEEDNDHAAALSNTLSHAGNVGPKTVACLTGGITDNSHFIFLW